MIELGYYILGSMLLGAIFYLAGRILVPKLFPFPIPIPVGRIGFAVFFIGVAFLVIRVLIVLLTKPRLFDITNTVEAYANITMMALACMAGYDAHKTRKPKSIKAGLHVAEDGGLHLVDPHVDPDPLDEMKDAKKSKPPK